MSRVIAICGIDCFKCDVYQATINNDENLRLDLVKQYTTKDHTPKPSDFHCEGCFKIKDDGCMIRQCATNKQVENCGVCDEYKCDRVMKHFEKSPTSQQILDEIRGVNT